MQRFKNLPARVDDSLYHYYAHVGIRRPLELYWRVFAYEILRWPDGVKPKKVKK